MKRWFFVLGILALFAMNSCTQEKTAAEMIVGKWGTDVYDYYGYGKQHVWEFRDDGTMHCVIGSYQDSSFFHARAFEGTYSVDGPRLFMRSVNDYDSTEMTWNGSIENIDDYYMHLWLNDGVYDNYISFYRTYEEVSNNVYLTFNLSDSFGDGWNGAYLEVNINNEYMPITMTIEDGHAISYSYCLFQGDEISLSWHPGGDDQECSFEILYEDGRVAFQNTGGFNTTYSFTIN